MEGIKHRRDLWKALTVVGDAAEIGVAEGYFSADMLSWPVNFPKVYMVDRWKTIPDQRGDAAQPQSWHESNLVAALRRTFDYFDRAVILRGNSVDMALAVPNGSLTLVYIDGDHSFEGVTNDINAWFPKLITGGGVMAFHDYENPAYGVKKAVNNLSRRFGKPIHLLPEDASEDAGAFIIF